MKNIYNRIDEIIGNTPMLELKNLSKEENISGRLLAKLEYFNPAGSVKDRVAKAMLDDAEEKGILKENSVIIEPTSGNTGIGLAAIATARGYKAIIVMPDTMSKERRKLMSAYGARVVLSDGKKGVSGAVEMALELSKTIENSFIPSQFENPANAKAHFSTTGPEIWEQTGGKLDFFVAGIGTGGTITGVGEYLKSQNPSIKIIAVEPFSSPLLSNGEAGPHKIQGIGANFIPQILNRDIYDEIIKVKNEDAYKAAERVVKSDGILVGISSGAALSAALELARRIENKGKTIVALLPDTGERYLSTDLFGE